MRKLIERPYVILGDVQVTGEMFAWFNLLTKGDEDRIAELAILNDECSTTPMTIIRYRKMLLEKQPKDMRIVEGTLEEISDQLEEMFLEPVDIGYVKLIRRIMQKNNWTFDDLIVEHYKDIERRIWRIISCENTKYIV